MCVVPRRVFRANVGTGEKGKVRFSSVLMGVTAQGWGWVSICPQNGRAEQRLVWLESQDS